MGLSPGPLQSRSSRFPTARADPSLLLQTGDGVEVMLQVRPVDRGDAAVALSFTVDDLGGVVSAWTTEGGAVIDPPRTQDWGEEQAVVRDLDGHIVCLVAATADRPD